MADLTLPGTIPGLLRRGSPIVFLAEDRIGAYIYTIGCRSVIYDIIDGKPVVDCNPVWPADVALDLTDATGRAHAAWWLMGLNYGHMQPLRRVGFYDICEVALYGHPQDAGWASGRVVGQSIGTIVPTLADLDPNDPRLLPDGSRWVDAEALRRVVLHVAGVSP